MKRQTLSRRAMLRGACGAAIGLPFLEAMLPSRLAHAADSPKRFIVMFTPNGWNINHWPTSTNLIGTSLEALQPFMDSGHLTVTRGLSYESSKSGPQGDASHYLGWSHMLIGNDADSNGDPNGVSVDQHIAGLIGAGSKFSSSLHSIYTNDTMSFAGPGQPVAPEYDPQAAWNRLFQDFTLDPAEQDKRRERRQSILDFTRDAAEQLSCRLGADDRIKLDQHLDSLRELEKQIHTTVTACSIPEVPDGGDPYHYYHGKPHMDELYPTASRLHTDLLVKALACDLTRVGTIQHTRAVGGGSAKWVPGNSNSNIDHHELSHKTDESSQSQIALINRWYAGELAYLMDQLNQSPDGDGTLLDNTAIIWVSEIGISVNSHELFNHGIVVGGRAGGYLAGGKYLAYDQKPHNNLLMEMVNAVLPAGKEPVSSFGNPNYCSGGLPELRA